MQKSTSVLISAVPLMLACGISAGRNAPAASAVAAPIPTPTATPGASPSASPAPSGSRLDNTGRNVRDQGGANITPEEQKETRADRELTAAIRRAIVKDKSLSLDAHNAKIITRNGMVTLRGPVRTTKEKDRIQSIASKTRGVKQVDNQLEAKSP